MSEMITTTGRSINTITAEILTITAQTNQMVVMNAIEVGRRLVEAKALVGHGEWGEYLKNEVQFSRSTANNLMKIYKEYGDKANSQALGNLPYTKMVRLLAVPEDEREEFVQVHDVENLSSRELEEAIRERKAAQEMLALAQESAAAAEQKAADREKEIAKLEKDLNKSTADGEKAQRELAKLQKDPRLADGYVEKEKKKAVEELRAEYEARLAAAQRQIQETADQVRADTAKALQEAQQQLDNAKKAEKMADPDALNFNALFKQAQETLNMLHGYLIKFDGSKPELAAACRKALGKILDDAKGWVA